MKKALEHWSGIVQVRSIISSNPLGFGGTIFGGYHVNEIGTQLSDRYVVVETSAKLLSPGNSVSQWEHWMVAGSPTYRTIEDEYKRYKRKELHVKATELYMVRQNGETIMKYLSQSDKFRGSGIGSVKARQLWIRFGDELYDILDRSDFASLSEVITEESATNLVKIWREQACGRFCSFLQSHRLPLKLVSRVIDFYGQEAEAKLAEDPYRLISFGSKWGEVDGIAQKKFGVASDDCRRLKGAIEAVLQQQYVKFKHTAVPVDRVKTCLAGLLAIPEKKETKVLIDKALDIGACNGSFVVTQEGTLYHGLGPRLMERLVANRIASMIKESEQAPSLMMSTLSKSRIDSLINSHEDIERKGRNDKTFLLNEEQRKVIHISVINRFSMITGGAGTGKTSTLKCLCSVLSSLGYAAIGLALAGKAVKRLKEVTGNKETYTIASFIRWSKQILGKLGGLVYVVIDEASMLDLQTTFKLCKLLPSSARVVLVGDPFQLPPIGPGLIFQQMIGIDGVPQTQLMDVKRQNDCTGIPAFAYEVRNHRWMTPNYPGVKFVECQNSDIQDKVLELASENLANTQILCATKQNIAGVEQINTSCQAKFNGFGKPIRLLGPNGNLYNTNYREGDRIIFLKNNYDRGTMNGTIGQIERAYNEDATGNMRDPVGTALVDDEIVDIYREDIDDDDIGISLGYAITVHKAQGSQWPRIIVPVGNSEGLSIIDATWVYTAITRAEHEIILVGDQATVKRAVEAPSQAHKRCVGFGKILEEMLII